MMNTAIICIPVMLIALAMIETTFVRSHVASGFDETKFNDFVKKKPENLVSQKQLLRDMSFSSLFTDTASVLFARIERREHFVLKREKDCSQCIVRCNVR